MPSSSAECVEGSSTIPTHRYFPIFPTFLLAQYLLKEQSCQSHSLGSAFYKDTPPPATTARSPKPNGSLNPFANLDTSNQEHHADNS